mmetsp:Transcript_81314/g.143462  ORF Transcript_81314/g.143462 Transcript_81314/m.143462 type:complete len:559 (+) Transcript_81314:101-1777(+)
MTSFFTNLFSGGEKAQPAVVYQDAGPGGVFDSVVDGRNGRIREYRNRYVEREEVVDVPRFYDVPEVEVRTRLQEVHKPQYLYSVKENIVRDDLYVPRSVDDDNLVQVYLQPPVPEGPRTPVPYKLPLVAKRGELCCGLYTNQFIGLFVMLAVIGVLVGLLFVIPIPAVDSAALTIERDIAVAATTPPPFQSVAFDCNAGYWNWEKGWSGVKKSYCCAHENKGCHASSPAASYDCAAGLSNWQAGWSDGKKSWCCHHENKGCVNQVATTYDCNAALSNWQHAWSESKKSWCCQHQHKGCAGASAPYDCTAGVDNWQSGWSQPKKDYCCHHTPTHLGCAPVQTITYDCDAGAEHVWSGAKRQWCCDHAQKGCVHTTANPLGCKAACKLQNEAATCHDRIQYAATHQFAHEENACGQAYSKVQVECDVCGSCTLQEASCQSLSVTIKVKTSQPFDCAAGYSNWKAGWSSPKKAWCCSHENRGCEGHVAFSKPYDCAAGYANWQHGWSTSKKAWCCSNEQKGCGGGQKLEYDCNAGLANAAKGWSAPKKDWCCQNEHKACGL